jgi:AcrR family transcriptional regulator
MPRVEADVLAAARVRLARDGYARMTIAAIADDARVSRPTVYRRWPSKADLITAALADISMTSNPAALSEDTRADLLTELRALQEALTARDTLGLVGAVLAEEQHNPELLELFRTRLLLPRKDRICTVLNAGQASGAVAADTDTEVLTDLLIGAFLSAHLAHGKLAEDFPERLVNEVWPRATW